MLTKRGAHKLLKNVHFPGEEDALRELKLAAAGKQSRQALIRLKKPSPERSSAAAIELQRVWRGYWTRCRLYEILNPTVSTQVHQTGSRFVHSEQGLRDVGTAPSKSPEKSRSKVTTVPSKESIQSKVSTVKTLSARQRLEGYYEKYYLRKKAKGEQDIISFEEFCAHYIQNWWHRIRRQRSVVSTGGPGPQLSAAPQGVRSVTISLSPESGRASVPHVAVRMQPKKKKRKARPYPLDPKEAAKMIQRAWRRHIDVQVYRYYRDLINFRCRGDPSMMLRCINPKEAQLLDAAAGIHIKFRLAGERFPPNIYYKIFTHRNVVDMCANSPKDYTAAAAKRRAARDVHNHHLKDGSGAREGEREGWYQRIENNGWRLVSDRLLLRPEQDPVTWESSSRKVDFPHTKLQRKQDVERKKKQRKVEWMKKMYREGMLQAKTEDSDTKSLVEGAAAGMVAAIESQGSEVVEEWEVDELLEWTSGLNFDDYLTSWKELATSSGSEKYVEERLKFDTTGKDPYEFSITFAALPTPSRLTSLQPPKTSPAVSVQ
ncbi:uncharacterized protein LOC110974614 [Acanthaster planci]|uniref:Uncharacterized protein LOC110974614 n=1 Tax=Acanthaster planci TaxID=133434 RepID=A0A8B7XMP9_ACAPL|nr:uncharacterized protein LOC110974614 [Acanthaster planci]